MYQPKVITLNFEKEDWDRAVEWLKLKDLELRPGMYCQNCPIAQTIKREHPDLLKKVGMEWGVAGGVTTIGAFTYRMPEALRQVVQAFDNKRTCPVARGGVLTLHEGP